MFDICFRNLIAFFEKNCFLNLQLSIYLQEVHKGQHIKGAE